MKYTLLSFFAILGLAGFSQTITYNEWPAVGDTLWVWGVTDTAGIANPASGTQKIWNYTGISLDKQNALNYKFLAPKDALNGSSFTNANVAITEPGVGGATSFYSISQNSVEVRGTNIAGNSALKYTNSYILMNFPSVYSNDILDALGGVLTGGPGGTTTSRFGNTRSRIIGTGILRLPGINYTNCVLAQITLNYKDSVSSLLGSFNTLTTEDRYMWFVPGTKGWVFEIKNTTVSNTITGAITTKNVYMKYPSAGTSGVSVETAISNKLTLYPNPACDYFHLETSEPGWAHVYNLQGQPIEAFYLHPGNHLLSIKGWKAGIYLIQLNHQTCRMVVTESE